MKFQTKIRSHKYLATQLGQERDDIPREGTYVIHDTPKEQTMAQD